MRPYLEKTTVAKRNTSHIEQERRPSHPNQPEQIRNRSYPSLYFLTFLALTFLKVGLLITSRDTLYLYNCYL